jgi:hypothetical protein
MVRALKLEQGGSGTYYNLSTGIIDSISGTTGYAAHGLQIPGIFFNTTSTGGTIRCNWGSAWNGALLRVVTLSGRRIYEKQLGMGGSTVIGTRHFAAGRYLVQLYSTHGSLSRSLLIQ